MNSVMYRKTTCLGCGYVQEDAVSYYKHSKTWKATHTLEKCREAKAVIAFGNATNPMSVVVANVDL